MMALVYVCNIFKPIDTCDNIWKTFKHIKFEKHMHKPAINIKKHFKQLKPYQNK